MNISLEQTAPFVLCREWDFFVAEPESCCLGFRDAHLKKSDLLSRRWQQNHWHLHGLLKMLAGWTSIASVS